ncbi:MAG: hypothetical protein WAT84_01625 [Candidatus Moraniibacteriota bacterium]
MKIQRSSVGMLFVYHGCDREVAEKILRGEDELQESSSEHDWLGPGIYFWVDSPTLAYGWARSIFRTDPKKIKEPYVLGAYINPGLCLNLTDLGVLRELRRVYENMATLFRDSGLPIPKNVRDKKTGPYRYRYLDCAVVRFLHQIRHKNKEPAYDSVLGVFEAGEAAFPGSSLRSRTHIQVAVRNHDNCSNILGYFRVPAINEIVREFDEAANRVEKN